jgi:hypothetical protein
VHFRTRLWIWAGAIALACLAAGCAQADADLKPAAAIVSPVDGAQYTPGEPVTVRVAAAASRGVARVELRQGGALIATQAAAPAAPTFTAVFVVTPAQAGALVLLANAVDAGGQAGDPASVTLQIVEQVRVLPTAPASADSAPGAPCLASVEFITDVTVPDNTVILAGAPFIKTWRLRNTSPCDWTSGYELAHIQGSQMSAPAAVPVSAASAGGTVDVSVTFVSPAEPGVYTSTWQLRTPRGVLFGNRVFTVIRVQ